MSVKLCLACMREAVSTGLEAISVSVSLDSQVWSLSTTVEKAISQDLHGFNFTAMASTKSRKTTQDPLLIVV